MNICFLCCFPDGSFSNHCGLIAFRESAHGQMICTCCECEHSLTNSTIFVGTRKLLTDWFKGMWQFAARRACVNAHDWCLECFKADSQKNFCDYSWTDIRFG